MTYKVTIGLEVHAELRTETKMFCNSKNNASESRPNQNVCPVCLAHPGTLPVINREAVHSVLRVGAAVGGALADYTEFDRKNYFYPDLPKGYQISQYLYPLVSGGNLNGVALTRIHLEEDTASSIHDEKTGATLVDFNRSGMPLMELVTEPVITSAQQAGDFGRQLQLLLRTLGVSDADMEKGQMRLEANISISDTSALGTKVEVKNINSFRAMERAVAYEVNRQEKLLEKGEKVVQETRGWDDAKQATFSQRVKEGAADYRYFPDPDLPSLKISEIVEYSERNLKKSLSELPWTRRERYISWGLKPEDAKQLTSYPSLGNFIDQVCKGRESDSAFLKMAANYALNDLVNIISLSTSLTRDIDGRDTEMMDVMPISPERFGAIINMSIGGKVSSRVAKDLLQYTIAEDRDPEDIAKERGLFTTALSEDAVALLKEILAKNASVVSDYKRGKEAALQFLVGQSMRTLKGAANPTELRAKIIELIQLM